MLFGCLGGAIQRGRGRMLSACGCYCILGDTLEGSFREAVFEQV